MQPSPPGSLPPAAAAFFVDTGGAVLFETTEARWFLDRLVPARRLRRRCSVENRDRGSAGPLSGWCRKTCAQFNCCPLHPLLNAQAGRPRQSPTVVGFEVAGGIVRAWSVEATAFFNAAGELCGTLATFRALDDGDELAATLRAEQFRFEAVLRASGQVVFKVEPLTGAVSWSGAASSLLGRQTAGVESDEKLLALLDEDDAREVRAAMVDAVASEWSSDVAALRRTMWIRRPDGTSIRALVDISGYPTPDGNAILGVLTDVTESEKHQVDRRQTQRMEALGLLAGGIAHDFNNLLTVILGNAAVLQKRFRHVGVQMDDLAEIERAAEQAAAMAKQLLSFGRNRPTTVSTLDINVALAEGVSMLRRLLGETVEVDVTFSQVGGHVSIDPGRFQQVLINLGVNARDAMSGRGTLRFDLTQESYGRAHDGVGAGRYMKLVASDTGCGMSAATQQRIFEPFFTTKGDAGSGLGLATVYGIVREASGQITVDSVPGEGTRFTLLFPVATVDEGRPAAAGDANVLVVEDDPQVLKFLHGLLTAEGYRVLTATSAEEALVILRASEGGLHLLVTDIVMSGESGADLASAVATEHPGIPVLFLSGYPSEVVEHHRVKPDATNFLPKPFGAEAFVERVSAILHRPAPAACPADSPGRGSADQCA